MAVVLDRSLVLVPLLLVVACSPATGPTSSPSTSIGTAADSATTTLSPATTTTIDTGDLDATEVVTVELDGVPLLVALASTSADRSQGLSGVVDLGDLDGMLFTWGGETVISPFNMGDTLFEIDIAFFDAAGGHVDGFRMVPCETDPCRSYVASGPYAYALERPARATPVTGPGSTLVLDG